MSYKITMRHYETPTISDSFLTFIVYCRNMLEVKEAIRMAARYNAHNDGAFVVESMKTFAERESGANDYTVYGQMDCQGLDATL